MTRNDSAFRQAAEPALATTPIQRRFPQIVLAFLAGAFGLTFVELILMGHTEKTQIAGLVTAGLGVLFCLAALIAEGVWRRVTLVLLVLLATEGLAGTVFHRIGDPSKSHEAMPPAAEAPVPEKHAPPLAPLSVTGLALLAAVALVARPKR